MKTTSFFFALGFGFAILMGFGSGEQAKELTEFANKTRQVGVEADDGESPATTIRGKDDAEMALIPAGEFQMGSDKGDSDEKPVHTVYLSAFYIDKYEVTTAQYAKFLNAVGRAKSREGKAYIVFDKWTLIEFVNGRYRPKAGSEKHPVNSVTWYGARDYAAFYGKRLPTEAEWEKAARGGLVGKKYPWGDASPEGKAMCNANWSKGLKSILQPVGSFQLNGYGLYDMAGNLMEWCADWYDANYYHNSQPKNPKGPSDGELRVLRSGVWINYEDRLHCAHRHGLSPQTWYPLLGFRCAQD